MGKKLGSNNAPSFFCCLMFQFEGRVKVHCQSLASSFPHFSFTIFVVTHFWVPTNKKKYNNNNNKKKKEFEQCRFDTVPLPAALHAVGAEPRQ
jgi:hypothetical protein